MKAKRRSVRKGSSTKRAATRAKPKLRLELEHVAIDRPKRRWNLYFVVAASHPTDPVKLAMTVLPSRAIPLRKASDNQFHFEPKGHGTEGLTVFERTLPAKKELIRVRLWVMHSRKATRRAGQVMKELTASVDDKAAPIATALGTTNPWVAVGVAASRAVGLIGRALAEIKDREMGMVVMDERIGPEFESTVEVDRSQGFSTGWGELCWSWSIN
jgi:hypothetical protein